MARRPSEIWTHVNKPHQAKAYIGEAKLSTMKNTALIIVGNCLGDEYLRSLLYDPAFTTGFRKASA